jgi:peptidoglycan/LPS O-acetylase OafA/YrhL
MRWVAAFAVFAYHIRNFQYFGGESGHLVDWAFGAGKAGVSFFFILSGFVLAWTARDGDRARDFWRRRVARVYPAHLVTALAALLLGLTLLPVLRPASGAETLANLLLVSSWKHAWWQALDPVSWTLACEAFFYASFPALYALARRLGPRGLTVLLWAAGAAVVLVPWANARWSLGVDIAHLPAARLPEFVLGVAAGRLVRLDAWRGPGMEVGAGLTVAGYFLIRQLPGEYAYAACTVLGLALLVPAAARADLAGTPSVWRHPWLVRLGEWSYAFYLVHILVLRLGERLFTSDPELPLWPALGAAAVAFALSLALAWALYERVERPGRRLLMGRRPGPRRTAEPAAAPPAAGPVYRPGPPRSASTSSSSTAANTARSAGGRPASTSASLPVSRSRAAATAASPEAVSSSSVARASDGSGVRASRPAASSRPA